MIRLLIENRADTTIENHNGVTPVHSTVTSCPLDTVVNVRDREDRTTTQLAFEKYREDIAQFLIQRNAYTTIRNNSDQSMVHYLVSSRNNVPSEERLGLLRLALKNGERVNKRDCGGRTALHWAAETDFMDAVVLLVESGADLNLRDEDGNTALHLATHPKTVEYLVRCGANVAIQNNNGHTALHLAAKIDNSGSQGHEETYAIPDAVRNMVKFLTYAKDTKRRSYVTIANILVSHSDFVVGVRDNTGSTALHLAAMAGNWEMVQFLTESNASVHVRESSGRTALHLAVAGGKLHVVELLLDLGVDFRAKDDEGCTALELATSKDSCDVIYMLVAHELAVNSLRSPTLSVRLGLGSCA